jgi:hypothetical protein
MSKLHKRHLEKKLVRILRSIIEQKNNYIHITRNRCSEQIVQPNCKSKAWTGTGWGALHDGKSTEHAIHFFGGISMLLRLTQKVVYDCSVQKLTMLVPPTLSLQRPWESRSGGSRCADGQPSGCCRSRWWNGTASRTPGARSILQPPTQMH